TLLSITEEHDAAVVEMGISDFGEMARLADMVRPDICIMTTIGFCHLETLGDLDGVLRAKSEVFEYMGENGVAIVNGDDEKLGAFDPGVRKITFGYGENNDWRGVNVRTDGTEGVLCDITNPDGAFSAYIPAFGSHMVLGALPAAIAARLLGLTDEEIERGLLKYAPVGGRANIQETGYIRIINDCYNANPNSMAASLASLSEVEGRKVAILGDMKELGAASRDLHRSIGDLAGQYKIDSLICLGAEAEFIYKGFIAGGYETEAWHFPMKEAMFSVLPRLIKEGDTVLVKASHSMGFDEVVEELKKLK
ncbi:MAG: UDP-N-acetylmuramoyl-tripeptide--D-alanyl-D-alanine ligase, partial [Oscillospiraceae bacterium]|nr:UDP-N-acetylmuramoyl-tripeptide--D-alanyl-D-alanine ligase [Oscillospiraceae bacterium]